VIRTLARLATAAGVALAAASPARAATVESGALVPPIGGILLCNVVNTGDVERTVTIEFLPISATPVKTMELLVAPNGLNSSTSVDAVRCRFTFKGPKKTLRFTLQVLDDAGIPVSAIEAR
jgi:hypothetical protein